ncbi:hypothetical protein HPE56_07050 [Maribacter sp. ANRC-HE7]|uniref:Por secretion system C-terminal sorting domain-containing protein n=1 Tax=Maribacter aquimaris TaxID=2737171 RepID=A0ABR7V0U2_9FLAO|nr:hypothetical protein [Maribacter aquimaris]MBD0777544.1 hypothetical protein [Maribacter aquimaris]
MKNLIKNSLVFIVMFTTFLVNANSTVNTFNDDPKTTLTLINVKQGNKLFVKDAFGITLYSETIQNSGDYIKAFDLTKLPDGDYFFELVKDLKIKTIPFTIKATVADIKKENEKNELRPFVKSEGNLVYISSPCSNKRPLEINIYFDDNGFKLIHSETIENTQNVNRMYSLNKTERGNYKIETKIEGRTFVDYMKL